MKKLLGIKKFVALVALLLGDSALPVGASIVRMFPFMPPVGLPIPVVIPERTPINHPYVHWTIPSSSYRLPPLPPPLVPAPIYIPHYTPSDDNYVDNNPTPTPIPTSIPVPKKPKVLGISTTDRQAPDFIQNKQVPVIVERIFKEVFGNRALDPKESMYWKFRARTDKATESKLRSTMKYYLSKRWTYSNL